MAFIDKAEEFIDKAKVEQLTDEQLDSVAGGTSTVYYGAPYRNEKGDMIINTLSVSGDKKYDPATRTVSGGRGSYAHLTIAANKLDDFLERNEKAGNIIFSTGIAGKLI